MARQWGSQSQQLRFVALSTLIVSFAAFTIAASSPLPLFGYVCPSCPSAINPVKLLQELHPAYTFVAFAFAGWDANGSIVNQWDAPDKGFTLSKTVVTGLQARGVKVLISLGGGAGNILPSGGSDSFAKTMLSGLLGLVSQFGVDGFDWDVENFQGTDAIADMAPVLSVITALKVKLPHLLITAAPQMTDVYPGWPSVSPGFNRYASLAATSFAAGHVDFIMPQMYNTWAAVETLEYAAAYAMQLQAGFVVANAPGPSFNVTIPGSKLMLGYPASPSGASSGYIDAASVVAMARCLAANGTAVHGLMTWDIGWDQQGGWAFANAVMNG